MSHELTIRSSGKAEMAYVGAEPWHKLGQKLADNASIDAWCKAAGMDWRIQRSLVRYHTENDGGSKLWPDKHVLFRSDTKAPLSIVSDGFKVVQPAQVLEFFRDLVGGTGFKLDTAGTLFGGKKFWALAKIEDGVVLKGDKVQGYLLLATACDGSMKTTGAVKATRVVCRNTMDVAMGERSKHSVKTSHRTEFNADNMKAELGLVHSGFERFMDEMRTLAAQPVSLPEAKHFTQTLLLDGNKAPTKEQVKEVEDSAAFKKIIDLFRGKAMGSNIPGVQNTAWGWLNAVTEFNDHHRTRRGDNADDNRLQSVWFGGAQGMKNRARELVLVNR